MIEDLIVLVDIITKKKVRQIEILTEKSNLSSKSEKLLEGLRSGSIKSDHDAIKLLYPNGSKNAYSKLKSRLYDRLLNTLFFIDIKKTGRSKIGLYRDNAYRKYTQIMIIRERGQRKLAVKMASKLLEQIKNIELHEISLLLSSFLEEHYSVWQLNTRLSEKYKLIYESTEQEIRAIRTITPIWSELANRLLNQKVFAMNSDEGERFLVQLQEAQNLRHKNSSYTFIHRLYSSWYFFYWLMHDYRSQINICEKALTEIQSRALTSSAKLLTFKMYSGISYLNLNDYKNAEQILNSILEEFNLTPGLGPWLNVFNYLFLIKIVNKEYSLACEILENVLELSNFKKLDKNWKDHWLIKEAYINFLIRIEKIDSNTAIGLAKRNFRLNKFLNTVSFTNKDKSGLNVSTLIVQFLFLLIQNKTEELYDKLDALKQYTHRYLKKDNTLRSNLFIRMLMTLPKSDFHPVRVEARTKDFWKKLQATPMMVSEQSHEVEIIPYEHLWEIVMEILHDRVKKKKSARR